MELLAVGGGLIHKACALVGRGYAGNVGEFAFGQGVVLVVVDFPFFRLVGSLLCVFFLFFLGWGKLCVGVFGQMHVHFILQNR